ncbi:allantoate amidohydrolase [Phreatobacter stygius]|uniref:allantoate amidohydrolase n=1 Tax=Phreatobacter stygius TaxID=1940610 RepID=UPI001FE3B0C3|nr:allantoate amidohydrolase [Phreatobacter stygius]
MPLSENPSAAFGTLAGDHAGIALGRAIVARLDELAGITDEPGVLTRLYLGPAHRRAVDLVSSWMTEAGMQVSLDGLGSLIGRYEGTTPKAPALVIGSHIDTVRNAGRFDGNLGVVTALEVVRSLHRRGHRYPLAIEVVAFGDEEGVRFASTLGGSRAMAGRFDAATLDERDSAGVSRREALASFGCDVATIPRSARSPADTLGYVEVHIEQGPVLEASGLAIGVVTAINGASRGTVALTGKASHAGTTPMDLRSDALAAAAEIILMVERRAREQPGLVATVGHIETPGGAVNTVPGKVRLTLDLRSPFDAQREAALGAITRDIRAIARARGIGCDIAMSYEAPAAPCDAGLSARLAASAGRCGVPYTSLPSGAGHDAMAFRGVLPFAMLFVRCRDGLSHHPDEFAAADDIDVAARVLADFLDHLAT